MTTMADIENGLKQKTPEKEIKYLPQAIDKERLTALALPYVDARYVQDTLDLSCGPFGWQTKIEDIGGFVCVGIGILNPDSQAWVWRWDTGQDEPTEKADWDDEGEAMSIGGKSVVSRGIKRAGVQWGIGRDIYDLPKRRQPIKPLNSRGKFTGWDRTRKPGDAAMTEAEREDGDGKPAADTKASTHVPEYNEFQEVAKKLKWTQEDINSVLQNCKNADTGRVDYAEALRRAKEQLPPAA